MTNRLRAPFVDRIDTDTDRTPLLAGTPTPTASSSTRSLSPGYTTIHSTTQTITNDDDDDDDATDHPSPSNHLRALLRPRVIILSIAVVFLVELAIGMSTPSASAIMESIICRQKHPELFPPQGDNSTGDVPAPPIIPIQPLQPLQPITPLTPLTRYTLPTTPTPETGRKPSKTRRIAGGLILVDDPACKGADVQGYLAMLRGWANTFESFPGLIGAVPYGILSDRWGRRPVLGLGVVGCVVSVGFNYGVFYFSDVVPLWVTWFSAAFQLIGGGAAIIVAMLYTMVADVVPAHERTTVFFQLNAISLGSQMIASPLGGAMLIWDAWAPLLVALAIWVVTNLMVLAFPETVRVHDRKMPQGEDHGDHDDLPRMTKLWRKAREGVAEVWDFVLGNKSVSFLMLSLVFTFLGRYVGDLLLQYSTDRYGWSWSLASMVLTIRNAGSLVTLLVLLPAASWFCVRRLGMEDMAKDLRLARWSGLILVLACLIIAAAANGAIYSVGLVWFALGSGMAAMIRSLLNALVEEHHVGTVNSLISFMEMVGMTIAGPLLAKSLSVGLGLGGAWVGLPFFAAGWLFVIGTTILYIFRLPNERRSPVEPPC
ncbi:major facilitator superfamily domain-containing protein [Chaetomium tenue]|uniref:Major facilitator superfamily domain-containing protein n=1 Tax=Chaetomium tenue TaxID=1854479 RepID=A0ACB7P6K0_9PEZI|nr:major facilitator superfamily domain-containing protein [Chaetomium globosum]